MTSRWLEYGSCVGKCLGKARLVQGICVMVVLAVYNRISAGPGRAWEFARNGPVPHPAVWR